MASQSSTRTTTMYLARVRIQPPPHTTASVAVPGWSNRQTGRSVAEAVSAAGDETWCRSGGGGDVDRGGDVLDGRDRGGGNLRRDGCRSGIGGHVYRGGDVLDCL